MILSVIRRVLALAFCAIVLSGCPSKESANGTTTGGGTNPDNKPAVPKFKELKTTDSVVGKGKEAKPGDLVIMKYVGTLTNGTRFDGNEDPDANPFSFYLGEGSVIPGWDKGIVGMKKGGKRRLEIPSDLGYGANGSGAIPPNADLIFEVELLDHVPMGEEDIFDKSDVKVGSGMTAKLGDRVRIHYVGTLANGKKFDDTKERGEPVEFQLGNGTIIGLDYAIAGMKVGGKRTMRIPPEVAYGRRGKPPTIPANSVLNFEVELLGVQPGKPQ